MLVRFVLVAGAILASAVLSTSPAHAFGRRAAPLQRAERPAKVPRENARKETKAFNKELKKGGEPAALEQLHRMSPEEKQRFFTSLPPDRRERLRKGLRRYEQLPPGQRERLQQAYGAFRKLPPGQQDAIRQAFKNFSQLPPDRRQAMRQEMRDMRSMSPEERRRRMNSLEYQGQFNPNERQIMDHMTSLAPRE